MSKYLDITEMTDRIETDELIEFIEDNRDELDEMGLLADYEAFAAALTEDGVEEALSEDYFGGYVIDKVREMWVIPEPLEGNIDWDGVVEDERTAWTEYEFLGETFLADL